MYQNPSMKFQWVITFCKLMNKKCNPTHIALKQSYRMVWFTLITMESGSVKCNTNVTLAISKLLCKENVPRRNTETTFDIK